MPRPEGLSGPFVSAAFLCERVLTERDGVPTFIRVAERFNVSVLPRIPQGVQLPTGFPIPNPVVQCSLVVMLKAGDMPGGRYTVHIDHLPPTGPDVRGPDAAAVFNGSDEHGVLIVAPLAIQAPPEGLHWFDIYFEDERLTRVPMRVIHQPLQIQFTHQPTQER